MQFDIQKCKIIIKFKVYLLILSEILCAKEREWLD